MRVSPWRLVVASALMLFVELALIRWTGANVLHLSYFSNFVLLGSFLGIGLGFLRSRHARDVSAWWPVVLAPLVAFVLVFPVQVTQNSDQILYFTDVKPTGAPEWVTLPLIFVAVAAVMLCLGEGVGRLFPGFPALTAYRLDLVGSLAGIVTFTVLSFLDAPPLGWGLIAAAGFVAAHRPRPAAPRADRRRRQRQRRGGRARARRPVGRRGGDRPRHRGHRAPAASQPPLPGRPRAPRRRRRARLP